MLYAIVAVLAIILDQAVKYWTTVNIVVDTGEAKLLPGLVHLANVHNTGAAFSFLEGARWFFVVLCIIFVLIVVYALAKDLITHPVCRWAAVFVLAGAVGNCIDRVVCGYVVDMFEFEFFRFPVFNVADIYITVGVIVFCIALLLEKPAGEKKAPSARASAPAASAEVETAPAPEAKAARTPAPRRHRKTDYPMFPKHDLPEVPAVDPNDPFAEWEKRANAAPEVSGGKTVYTQPAQDASPVEIPEVEIPAPVVHPVRDAAPEAPAAPAAPAEPSSPVEPTAPEAPAAPASDEFDLDSILAEFKDF